MNKQSLRSSPSLLGMTDDASGYEEEADEVEELRVNKTGCLNIVL